MAPLHWATEDHSKGCLTLLLTHGAVVNVQNKVSND